MQAAFVDIGLEKAGFVHVSDLFGGPLPSGLFEEDEEHDLAPAEDGAEEDHPEEDRPALGEATAPPGGRGRRERFTPHIPLEERLKKNQEILVQIAKEPIGTKGSRLTSFISLPGRHLVYMPTTNHLGMSRRIESADERNRLRSIVGEVRPPQGGFIIRTACEGVSKREIQQDVTFLTRLWADVVKKSESQPPATLLYADLDLALRAIRDLFSSDVDRLWCDHPPTHERLAQFVQQYMPR